MGKRLYFGNLAYRLTKAEPVESDAVAEAVAGIDLVAGAAARTAALAGE